MLDIYEANNRFLAWLIVLQIFLFDEMHPSKILHTLKLLKKLLPSYSSKILSGASYELTLYITYLALSIDVIIYFIY